MPADPIELRVLQSLQTALGRISREDGYHHDVVSLVVKLDPNQAADQLAAADARRPLILLEPKPEVWDYSDSPESSGVDLALLIAPYTIHWFNTTDPTKDPAKVTEYYRACADIEMAVQQDPTRGMLAADSRIQRRTYDQLDGSQIWAMVDVHVRLYRQIGKPNG